MGHGIVDLYGSFLSPLIPLFAARFNLSLTLIGTLASIFTVADGLSQPLFGYWEDRMRRPWLLTLSPLWVGIATGFLGISTGYATLAMLLVISGAGRSAYHPEGAATISYYAGNRKGFALSIFTAAGNLGFAFGPILATSLVTVAGLPGTLYSIPIGLAISTILYNKIFKDNNFRSSTWTPPSFKEILNNFLTYRNSFISLWFIVVLRSLTYFSLFSFLPVIFVRKGLSTIETGIMTSLFLFGGAIGGIIGGWLSDRFHEHLVITTSLILAFPAIQFALVLPGIWGILFLIMGGFFLLASAPITISLAQRYAPGSVATASSLMLGMGWGTGGLLVTLVGVLADQIGLLGALRLEVFCLLIAAFLAYNLPKIQ